MWEMLKRHPRGRISLRVLPILATGLLAAFLACISAGQPAFAEDIVRTANGFTYQGKQYTAIGTIQAGDSRKLTTTQPVTAYQYLDTAGGTAEYIYFANGVDPQSTSSACA